MNKFYLENLKHATAKITAQKLHTTQTTCTIQKHQHKLLCSNSDKGHFSLDVITLLRVNQMIVLVHEMILIHVLFSRQNQFEMLQDNEKCVEFKF